MERGRLGARGIVVLGLLGALLVVLQVTMALLPNIEPVSLLVMVYTAVLGRRAAYPIAVFVALEALIWGVSTWVLSYLYVWAVLAVLPGCCGVWNPGWAGPSFPAPSAWAFGALCALVYLPVGGWRCLRPPGWRASPSTCSTGGELRHRPGAVPALPEGAGYPLCQSVSPVKNGPRRAGGYPARRGCFHLQQPS